jgi:hypothetical protein
MTDVQTLVCVLVVLYLIECVAVPPRAGASFVAWIARRYRLHARGLGSPGDRSGLRLHPLPPLPPLGTVYLASEWPFEIEPDGIVLATGTGAGAGAERIPYPAGATLQRDGSTLRLGSNSIGTWSARFATHLESVIDRIRALPRESRPEAIASAWQRRLDTRAIRKEVGDLDQACRGLRLACNAHFGLVLVVAPTLMLTRGIVFVWLPLLATYVVSAVVLVYLFFRAARRLGRGAWGERWEDAMILFLSPLSAIRARDRLSRDHLAAYHPIAVAKALAGDEEFRSFASLVLRDRRFRGETLDVIEGWTATAVKIADRELERFLKREAYDVASERSRGASPDSRAFCPVCLAEYSVAEGVCNECSIALVPYGARTA